MLYMSSRHCMPAGTFRGLHVQLLCIAQWGHSWIQRNCESPGQIKAQIRPVAATEDELWAPPRMTRCHHPGWPVAAFQNDPWSPPRMDDSWPPPRMTRGHHPGWPVAPTQDDQWPPPRMTRGRHPGWLVGATPTLILDCRDPVGTFNTEIFRRTYSKIKDDIFLSHLEHKKKCSNIACPSGCNYCTRLIWTPFFAVAVSPPRICLRLARVLRKDDSKSQKKYPGSMGN